MSAIKVNLDGLDSSAIQIRTVALTLGDLKSSINSVFSSIDPKIKRRRNIGGSIADIQKEMEMLYTEMNELSGFISSSKSQYANTEARLFQMSSDYTNRFRAMLASANAEENWLERIGYAVIGNAKGLESFLKQAGDLIVNVGSKVISGVEGVAVSWHGGIITCLTSGQDYTSAQKGIYIAKDNQAIIYNGETYPIVVPNTKDTCQIEKSWKTVYEKRLNKIAFDWAAATLGINLQGIPKEEVCAGNQLNHHVVSGQVSKSEKNVRKAGAFSAILGIESFIDAGIDKSEITFIFQQSGSDKRVLIPIGSYTNRNKFNNVDCNIPNSIYIANAGSAVNQVAYSNGFGEMYEALTKKKRDQRDIFDVQFTIDKQHQDTPYYAYLSISPKGELIENPIVFSKDKAVLGRRPDFFRLNFEPLVDITDKMSTPSTVPAIYSEILNKALTKVGNK
ncbi:hypothetical protein [Caproiciproducens galactitolivorans]|uniref:Uncharacterized protein n=1 Tax=Caproiciproducens galactitolivorans TaxID=642589 RepID=A0ABT4BRT0_9FIRM|nr:hypothetical protein [Caproiciproducens galactitolivorans]MCY1713598.1 hypothetical protein [Caproiciproducens galactitolivorans]